MKKRAWITALGLLITVSPTQAEENTSAAGYLNTMNQLYQFAWGQQYPMDGPYDVCLTKTEEGYAQSYSYTPQTAWGYQIRDFDQDGQMELLLAGPNTENDGMLFRMYEVQDGTVTLQSQVSTDSVARVPEEGCSKCYSYLTDQSERMIGYDVWYYMSYTADGTTASTELFRYDGMTLTKVDGYSISGSAIDETTDIAGNYERLGIHNVDATALISGQMSGCQYLSSSEVFVETENQLLERNTDEYAQWLNAANAEPYILGGAYIKSNCWLPSDVATRTWGAQQLPQRVVQQKQAQNQIDAVFSAADYMYVSYDEELGVQEVYYLVPDEGKSIYQCYDRNGNLCYNIPYNNAKGIVDGVLGGSAGLPCSANRCMILWDSPYGLCAYDHAKSDYYPVYVDNGNGQTVLTPKDLSTLGYILDETAVAQLANRWNLTVPNSAREQ